MLLYHKGTVTFSMCKRQFFNIYLSKDVVFTVFVVTYDNAGVPTTTCLDKIGNNRQQKQVLIH